MVALVAPFAGAVGEELVRQMSTRLQSVETRARLALSSSLIIPNLASALRLLDVT